MTEVEYEKKKGPVRRVIDWIKAAILWVKNRRSARRVARSIASNQVATAALAASVAAAGIGGYGAVQAYEAKQEARSAAQGVAGIQQRLADVEANIRQANVALAQAQYQLEVLKDRTTQGFRNLRSRLNVLVREVDSTARNLRNLPAPTPQHNYQPAIDRAKLLADNAQKAADAARTQAITAQNAAQEAQKNAVDPEARAAAAEAAQAAADAADTARDAQDAANDLKEEAADLQVQIDAIPPGYQPFPRTITYPDYVEPAGGSGGQLRNFEVDLPAGTYRVTVRTHGESVQPWYVDLSAPGIAAPRAHGTGSQDVETSLTYTTGGGTTTFSVRRDGFNPSSTVTYTGTTITIEEVK